MKTIKFNIVSLLLMVSIASFAQNMKVKDTPVHHNGSGVKMRPSTHSTLSTFFEEEMMGLTNNSDTVYIYPGDTNLVLSIFFEEEMMGLTNNSDTVYIHSGDTSFAPSIFFEEEMMGRTHNSDTGYIDLGDTNLAPSIFFEEEMMGLTNNSDTVYIHSGDTSFAPSIFFEEEMMGKRASSQNDMSNQKDSDATDNTTGTAKTGHSVETGNDIPDVTEKLSKVYPNPFVGTSTIEYRVTEANTPVSLMVFDMNGKLVAELLRKRPHLEGTYQQRFDGSGLPGGFYFYQLHVGNKTEQGKMILRK